MVAIEVDGLTKRYGETVGIEDVSFAVEPGEIFGYLGPNGAGKTTTIRTLLGFLAPTSGDARVLGYDIRSEADLIAAKRRIGFVPDHLGFDGGVTGERILEYHAGVKGGCASGGVVIVVYPAARPESQGVLPREPADARDCARVHARSGPRDHGRANLGA